MQVFLMINKDKTVINANVDVKNFIDKRMYNIGFICNPCLRRFRLSNNNVLNIQITTLKKLIYKIAHITFLVR